MTTWTITFADTFINELLNIPKSISKKVSKKIKILEKDPISARGDAKKLKGHNNNIYRVRIGNYRLFYSFGSGWVKLLSVRKRDDRTYELEIPEVTVPNPVPKVAYSESQLNILEQEDLSSRQELQEDNTSDKNTPESDLPFKFTSALLKKWHIPQEYWQEIQKIQHSDDILDLSIPDRFISRILDNCFPRNLEDIERSPNYQLTKPEDLERFIEGEVEAFLLKLDPEQEKLLDFGIDRGAVLVKGGAGAGKSTLALYRVKRLIEEGYNSILFTTYTNALSNYSQQLLEQLLRKPPEDLGVKVATVDSLIYQYYANNYGKPNLVRAYRSRELLNTALAETKIPAKNIFEEKAQRQYLERLGIAYLLEEFETVIDAWGISEQKQYSKFPRRGRGLSIKASQREAIWKVYETWRNLLKQHRYVTFAQMRCYANEIASNLPQKPFEALIIDEAQDLSPIAIRFLINLVSSSKGIYLTADASQSLYQRGFSWKQVHEDLKVAGRTLILKRNYRNTQQITQACKEILDGTNAGDKECLDQELSPYTGDRPQILLSDNLDIHISAILQAFTTAAKKYRLPLHGGAILCPTNKLGEEVARKLQAKDVKAQFFSSKKIDLHSPHVKVLTLHSAKGLEFPFVAVVGLEEGVLPAIDRAIPPDEVESVLEQQRRLFYVGCSRAMRFLIVCGSSSNPSSFLTTLKDPYWQY
ncbi:3'-5' exonuclease [Myxosarcina sp. GI1]|uniref:3'-5' exonuclease n=1 Tax=Myxosarcina sp. GI1 TaxID=1541065 RepID=UPI0005606D87|nr:3'-5' exonuclease [Myxosarcina sp. GI1]